jgi:hypothetical protein
MNTTGVDEVDVEIYPGFIRKFLVEKRDKIEKIDRRYTFLVSPDTEDEYENFLNKYYKKISGNPNYDLCYQVSEFLQKKLELYEYVKNYDFHSVWSVKTVTDDKEKIIKRFWGETKYNHNINIQTILQKYNIGCKLLDNFYNDIEYYTVSEYGGENLAEKFPDDSYDELPDNIKSQIDNIDNILNELNLEQCDDNFYNYVVDSSNKVRIIDYDDIYYKNNIPKNLETSTKFDYIMIKNY